VAGLRALPTEPLLDDPTAGLGRWSCATEITRWLDEIAEEGDADVRCGLLAQSLRKQTDGPLFVAMGRGLLAAAVRGEPRGVAVLAGLLAVHAPGEALVESVREFSNLHREITMLRRMREDGNPLGKPELDLLESFERIDAELATQWAEPASNAGMRDRGPAWRLRRAFGSVVAELEATGNLEATSLDRLLRLAHLELNALELRASSLAGAINPYSARHVGQVIPILGGVDTDLRDMRRFLTELGEHRRIALFHEQLPAIGQHLDAGDEKRLRARIEQEDDLQLLRRLLRGLDRNPLPGRSLAWFADRVLAVGGALHEQGLRKQPMDLVSALLCIYDLHRDGLLHIPASPEVCRIVGEAGVEAVEVVDGAVRVVLDPFGARRFGAPLGLPQPSFAFGEAEESGRDQTRTVKDLVLSNMNNTSVLLGLLKNQKVVSTPGIVAIIAQRSRNMRVLDTICSTRDLHTGSANRDVPLAILRSPMNIPVKVLRRFINVRYVSKVDLRRLANDRAVVRREIVDELESYLKSLN
jgi:hypothetical protein